MTKEEIEAYVVLLRDELDRERQERNLAVLEKDRIVNFWEVTKKNLEDSRALLSKKERELEDADERHQLEMKVSLIDNSEALQVFTFSVPRITEERKGFRSGYWFPLREFLM